MKKLVVMMGLVMVVPLWGVDLTKYSDKAVKEKVKQEPLDKQTRAYELQKKIDKYNVKIQEDRNKLERLQEQPEEQPQAQSQEVQDEIRDLQNEIASDFSDALVLKQALEFSQKVRSKKEIEDSLADSLQAELEEEVRGRVSSLNVRSSLDAKSLNESLNEASKQAQKDAALSVQNAALSKSKVTNKAFDVMIEDASDKVDSLMKLLKNDPKNSDLNRQLAEAQYHKSYYETLENSRWSRVKRTVRRSTRDLFGKKKPVEEPKTDAPSDVPEARI
jgi:hypothetical protein